MRMASCARFPSRIWEGAMVLEGAESWTMFEAMGTRYRVEITKA